MEQGWGWAGVRLWDARHNFLKHGGDSPDTHSHPPRPDEKRAAGFWSDVVRAVAGDGGAREKRARSELCASAVWREEMCALAEKVADAAGRFAAARVSEKLNPTMYASPARLAAQVKIADAAWLEYDALRSRFDAELARAGRAGSE